MCHFEVTPTSSHIIYHRRGIGASFPRLGHDVFCEFDLFMVDSCIILALICINYLFFWFVQLVLFRTFTFEFDLVHLRTPTFIYLFGVNNATWVYILLQMWKLTRFFTLIPLYRLNGVTMEVKFLNFLKSCCFNNKDHYIVSYVLEDNFVVIITITLEFF